MKNISKLTISTIAYYRRSEGCIWDRLCAASDYATTLYMYGNKKLGIEPWDKLAYEQAMEELDKIYRIDDERIRKGE